MTSRATSGFATRSESDTSSDNETERKGTRKRILTGDRPTGKLHVGHYVGTLQNRVRLQDEYETFLLIADYHMLTSRLTKLEEIEQNIRDDVIDNLTVGADPDKVTYFLESRVAEVPAPQFHVALVVPVPRAMRARAPQA